MNEEFLARVAHLVEKGWDIRMNSAGPDAYVIEARLWWRGKQRKLRAKEQDWGTAFAKLSATIRTLYGH